MSTSDVIMLLVPIIIMIILYSFKWIDQRLPPAKRAELDYYANKAVKYVEQTCKGASSQKKSAAISIIYTFFRAINKPAPAQIFIDAAIEEVVWEINQLKIPGLKNTGPIRAVIPPPDAGGQPA